MNKQDVFTTVKMALEAISVYSPDYMHGEPKKVYVKALRKLLAELESGDLVVLPKNERTS